MIAHHALPPGQAHAAGRPHQHATDPAGPYPSVIKSTTTEVIESEEAGLARRYVLSRAPQHLVVLARSYANRSDVGPCNGVTCSEQRRRQTVEYRVLLDDYVEWGSWRCGQRNDDDPTAMLARVSRTTGAKCHSR
jgi:hypothetical protein